MEVHLAGPPNIRSEQHRAYCAENSHDGWGEVKLLLRMMLLQPLVLHQLVHQLLAIPPRTGAMWRGGFLGVSQSGPTVPGTAMLPRVLSTQALGSGGAKLARGSPSINEIGHP